MNLFGLPGMFGVLFPIEGWWRVLVFFEEVSGGAANRVILGLLTFASPLAVLGTLVGLAWGSWPSRARWRRRLGRPGMVACLASAASWPVAGAFALGFHRFLRGSPWAGGWNTLNFDVYILSTLGGFAVAVAWATLALNRRWRNEPTWSDRLGRVVGLVWVVMFVLACYFLLWKPA
jgi:hypothetical protein